MKKIIFVSLFLFCSTAHARVVETWECGTTSRGVMKDILVVATVNRGHKSGKVKMAGKTYKASFKVKGFERRWDFGNANYSLIIDHDGQARYYDFTGVRRGQTAQPSMFLTCQLRTK